STLHGVTDDQKRWVVFGIALSKVLVTQIRPFVEQEVQKEYVSLSASHSIHTQSTSGRLKHWPTFLKYENINGNDAFPRLPGGRCDYSKFDCRVTSHVDFAKLYVENHMAKFNAFDEHCDASAMLALLGTILCMNPTVDPDLLKLVQQHVNTLRTDVDQLTFEVQEDRERVSLALNDLSTSLDELEARMARMQCEQGVMKQEQSSLSNRVDALQTDIDTRQEDVKLLINSQQEDVKLLKSQQEDVQQRVAHVEDQLSSAFSRTIERTAVMKAQQMWCLNNTTAMCLLRLPVLKLTSHFLPSVTIQIQDSGFLTILTLGSMILAIPELCTPWRSRSRQKCARSSPGTAHERDWTLRRCLLLPSQRWHKKRSQVSSWDYR
ncbi:hypothetical protein OS493_037535, partial [Desmophyllum pertusum]